MKSQSFEYQLRHAVPPAADPQAKARAQRAAVEEFERIHAQRNSASAVATEAPPPVTRAETPAPGFRGWWPKPALLGGLASACVVVVGASLYWLMPAEQRTVKLHQTLPDGSSVDEGLTGAQARALPTTPAENSTATSPGSQAQTGTAAPTDASTTADSSTTAASQADGEAVTVTPSSSEDSKPVVPATIGRGERQTSAASSRGEIASTDAEARRTPNAQLRAEAKDSTSQRPTESSTPNSSSTAITDFTDRPVPKAPPPPASSNSQQSADASAESEDITVTGSRILPRTFNSPSPIASVGGSTGNTAANNSSDELQESVVTATRQSGRRARLAREKAERTSSITRPDRRAPQQEPAGGDKFKHFEINPVKRVADAPISTFSTDVDTSSYSFVRRQLNDGALPPVDSVRVEEMINYFDYAWPTPESREQPFKPTVTVSDSPWSEGKKLIHIGIKGYALPVEQQQDVNLVLLLDVSGSMDSPDKLPLAQQSMALLLDSLKPTDTVGIVVYAGAAGMVLAPTPVREKDTILQALNSLRPGGSTAGAEGIKLAYELAEKNFRKNGVNRILLATDGDFNVGISDEDELKGFVQRERQKGVFLSVLGFGTGNYHDETAQVLAQNGNGTAAYIDSLNEAKKVLVQQSTGSLFTIAKDVKLQVEFNPTTVSEYRLVGYETRALNTEDFNNDKVDAGDVGAGHTVTAIYEITPVGSVAELIGERRYAASQEQDKPVVARGGKTNEYGFLKIRYKLPNGYRSRLMEQPILVNTGVPASLRKDVEFSTAVAGFGQLLRGGAYTGSLSYEEVMQQAENGLSNDPHGYRREFMELVRRAARVKAER